MARTVQKSAARRTHDNYGQKMKAGRSRRTGNGESRMTDGRAAYNTGRAAVELGVSEPTLVKYAAKWGLESERGRAEKSNCWERRFPVAQITALCREIKAGFFLTDVVVPAVWAEALQLSQLLGVPADTINGAVRSGDVESRNSNGVSVINAGSLIKWIRAKGIEYTVKNVDRRLEPAGVFLSATATRKTLDVSRGCLGKWSAPTFTRNGERKYKNPHLPGGRLIRTVAVQLGINNSRRTYYHAGDVDETALSVDLLREGFHGGTTEDPTLHVAAVTKAYGWAAQTLAYWEELCPWHPGRKLPSKREPNKITGGKLPHGKQRTKSTPPVRKTYRRSDLEVIKQNKAAGIGRWDGVFDDGRVTTGKASIITGVPEAELRFAIRSRVLPAEPQNAPRGAIGRPQRLSVSVADIEQWQADCNSPELRSRDELADGYGITSRPDQIHFGRLLAEGRESGELPYTCQRFCIKYRPSDVACYLQSRTDCELSAESAMEPTLGHVASRPELPPGLSRTRQNGAGPRDHYWLHIQNETGWTQAQIRDHWDGLPEAVRREIAPNCHERLSSVEWRPDERKEAAKLVKKSITKARTESESVPPQISTK